MTIVTGSQIRAIESDIFRTGAYRADIAMSLAGKALANAVETVFDRKSRIGAVCGYGNNGGDGFAASYFLYANNYDITVFFDDKKTHNLSSESAYFHSLCNNAGIVSSISDDFDGFDVLIDCLLGSGLAGAPKPETIAIIDRINLSGSRIISADIPSGLCADGPVDHDHIVKAERTVAMQFPKINTLIYPGKEYSGEVSTVRIGFPPDCIHGIVPEIKAICSNTIEPIIPARREKSVHKYDKGHLLIVGGFTGTEGAALLAAESALNAGAGLVTIATQQSARTIIAGKVPEIMTSGLPDSLSDLKRHIAGILSEKKITGILIGPGLGRSEYSSGVFEAVIGLLKERKIRNMLIDGDALYHISVRNEMIPDDRNVVITPHTGEGARLLGKPSADVAADLYHNASDLFEKMHATVVLKGSSTVVFNGRYAGIWSGGIPSLATAGSGDVLAGIIAALMIQKDLSGYDAAVAGVFIHGNCGLNGCDVYSASDIVRNIPRVISHFLKA